MPNSRNAVNGRGKGSSAKSEVRIPKICFDRVLPKEYHEARRATEHAMLNMHMRIAMAGGLNLGLPAMATPGVLEAGGVYHPPRMAIQNLKKWPVGHRLTCRFLDGSNFQMQKVRHHAKTWEEYANIHIDFVQSGDVEIRISFSADSGSWSAVGTDALVESYFPKYQPTMNFGWLRDDTDDDEYQRVVLHEFGHALGCIHEHQNPDERLQWDKKRVYEVFSGPPNYWSKTDIDENILKRYGPKDMSYTPFDLESVMLYQFDASLFTDHMETPLNRQLSETDKRFIGEMYPLSNTATSGDRPVAHRRAATPRSRRTRTRAQ